jgi:hypothetical protein
VCEKRARLESRRDLAERIFPPLHSGRERELSFVVVVVVVVYCEGKREREIESIKENHHYLPIKCLRAERPPRAVTVAARTRIITREQQRMGSRRQFVEVEEVVVVVEAGRRFRCRTSRNRLRLR